MLLQQQLFDFPIGVCPDAQQQLSEGSRTHAPTAGLHAEQVVKQRSDELEVQEPVAVPEQEREYRQVFRPTQICSAADAVRTSPQQNYRLVLL